MKDRHFVPPFSLVDREPDPEPELTAAEARIGMVIILLGAALIGLGLWKAVDLL